MHKSAVVEPHFLRAWSQTCLADPTLVHRSNLACLFHTVKQTAYDLWPDLSKTVRLQADMPSGSAKASMAFTTMTQHAFLIFWRSHLPFDG